MTMTNPTGRLRRPAGIGLSAAKPERRRLAIASPAFWLHPGQDDPGWAFGALESYTKRPSTPSADLLAANARLPAHLGWESTAVTAHLRQSSMVNSQLPMVNEDKAATAGSMPAGQETPPAFLISNSALRTPHSQFRTRHSASRVQSRPTE